MEAIGDFVAGLRPPEALDAMVRLGDLELKSGRPDGDIAAANKSISMNGLREDAHRLLIRTFAVVGRRADALNVELSLEELDKELVVAECRRHSETMALGTVSCHVVH